MVMTPAALGHENDFGAEIQWQLLKKDQSSRQRECYIKTIAAKDH
jgi:hypothetical protein